MATNFEKVSEFNAVLGQGIAAKPSIAPLQLCKLRLDLIREEAVEEMAKAMDQRDIVALADAIGDALVVVYGAANDAGLDADKIMEIVHAANMSKLAQNEEEAKEAVARYAAGDGFHGKDEPIDAGYRAAPGQEGKFVIFNKQTGKTLKAPGFTAPEAALEAMIFPEGRPEDQHAELRAQVRAKVEAGEMSHTEAWQFQATLDVI